MAYKNAFRNLKTDIFVDQAVKKTPSCNTMLHSKTFT